MQDHAGVYVGNDIAVVKKKAKEVSVIQLRATQKNADKSAKWFNQRNKYWKSMLRAACEV